MNTLLRLAEKIIGFIIVGLMTLVLSVVCYFAGNLIARMACAALQWALPSLVQPTEWQHALVGFCGGAVGVLLCGWLMVQWFCAPRLRQPPPPPDG